MNSHRHEPKLQIIRDMTDLLLQLEQDIITEEWMQELCIDDLEANMQELARLVRRRSAAIGRKAQERTAS